MEYQFDYSLAPELWRTLDAFTQAYVETAMWTLTDDDGHSLDYLGLQDIAPETIEIAKSECADFVSTYGDFIADDLARAGHDFWLTRNHHGAGFWDGDWPEDRAKVLTDASHAYGSADWYVGDDGLVYQA